MYLGCTCAVPGVYLPRSDMPDMRAACDRGGVGCTHLSLVSHLTPDEARDAPWPRRATQHRDIRSRFWLKCGTASVPVWDPTPFPVRAPTETGNPRRAGSCWQAGFLWCQRVGGGLGGPQRKALIEALIAHVKITGPGQVIPVFRIPQTADQSMLAQPAVMPAQAMRFVQ